MCENEIGLSRNAERKTILLFSLRVTIEPKILGAVIPRSVFTQPGSFAPFECASVRPACPLLLR